MIDVQSENSSLGLALAAAGVKGVRYPARFADLGTGEVQPGMGVWQVSAALPADQRGTHMSRMMEELHAFTSSQNVDLLGLAEFVKRVAAKLNAVQIRARVELIWSVLLPAPVSGKQAWATYDLAMECAYEQGATRSLLTIDVPVKAVCPCSKAISDRGAHNQRSKVSIELSDPAHLLKAKDFATVIRGVESQGSSPLYPLLKREDEKYVTERAYDHPVFVEDLCRRVATWIATDLGAEQFRVRVVNFESIHPYDCFAELVFPNS